MPRTTARTNLCTVSGSRSDSCVSTFFTNPGLLTRTVPSMLAG
jgi:hypothetical protein